MHKFGMLLVLLLLLLAVLASCSAKTIHPIILVPGDGGSQIEARINRTKSIHFWCYDHTDWYDLWLNIEQMLPPAVLCWEENIKLRYDPKTHTTQNAVGVETRIPGFGGTFSVEYLDKSKRSVGLYFAPLVNQLAGQGYVRGKTIRGAPYDFRKAANEQEEYFKNLQSLIEETYHQNGNTPVVLMTHSMGSIMTLHFLNTQSQKWKDTFIQSFISLAGVWGGTVDAIKVFAVGDNLRSRFLSEKNLLWQRTCPSLAWLMPSRDLWDDDFVFVSTSEVNFTRLESKHLFESLSAELGPNMMSMINDTKNILSGLPAPGVEVYCIHSSEVPTVEQLNYGEGYFPGYDPTYVYGDGDGTVNKRSLEGCLRWRGQQSYPIHHMKLKGLDHLGMLKAQELIDKIGDLIESINNLEANEHDILNKLDKPEIELNSLMNNKSEDESFDFADHVNIQVV